MKGWPLWTGLALVVVNTILASDTNSPPVLSLFPAIELAFFGQANQVYQLQVSTDAKSWTNYGPQIAGAGEPVSKLYSVRSNGRLFHRLEVVPASQIPTNQLPNSLSGRIVDFTAADGAAENLTFATDKWVRSSVEGTGTYQFGYNGNKASLQVSFPSGTTYNLVLTFNPDGKSGTWSGNQFYDNSDHPVDPGATFQIEN